MGKKMWGSFLKRIHFSPCHLRSPFCHPRPSFCHPREGGDPEKQTQNHVVMLNLFQLLRIKKIPKQVRDDSIAYSWIPAFAGMTREGNTIRLTA